MLRKKSEPGRVVPVIPHPTRPGSEAKTRHSLPEAIGWRNLPILSKLCNIMSGGMGWFFRWRLD